MQNTKLQVGNVRQLIWEDTCVSYYRRQLLLEGIEKEIIPPIFPSWCDMVQELIQPYYHGFVNVSAFCLGQQPQTAENRMNMQLLYLRFAMIRKVVEANGSD